MTYIFLRFTQSQVPAPETLSKRALATSSPLQPSLQFAQTRAQTPLATSHPTPCLAPHHASCHVRNASGAGQTKEVSKRQRLGQGFV